VSFLVALAFPLFFSGSGCGGGGGRPNGGNPDAGAGGAAGAPGGSDGGDDAAGVVVRTQATVRPGPASCAAAPASESPASIEALNRVNDVRVAIGVPCLTLAPSLSGAAQKHCIYYAANAGDPSCIANAHVEDEFCSHYFGRYPDDRTQLAGYAGSYTGEVMYTRAGDPDESVGVWINTVWHRTPLLDPWAGDMGYGGTTAPEVCNTVDVGNGTGAATLPDTAWAVYPFDGQTDVPVLFPGGEIPEPPAPPSGWPSGFPVSLYVKGATIQSHEIMIDGTTTPIDHVWIDATTPDRVTPYEYFLYTNTPLLPNTTYRVRIAATRGTTPLSFDWRFTTGNGGPAGACDLFAADSCGAGSACYRSVCAPAGSAPLGAACVASSDCVPGATCTIYIGIGGRQDLCSNNCSQSSSAPSAVRCDTLCPDDFIPQDAVWAVCPAP
jgi:uncharacterized protein YkwD